MTDWRCNEPTNNGQVDYECNMHRDSSEGVGENLEQVAPQGARPHFPPERDTFAEAAAGLTVEPVAPSQSVDALRRGIIADFGSGGAFTVIADRLDALISAVRAERGAPDGAPLLTETVALDESEALRRFELTLAPDTRAHIINAITRAASAPDGALVEPASDSPQTVK